jgi:quercetin dioxygenase-like cupin family protein
MLLCHRLPFDFDSDALKTDLDALQPGDWTRHFNRDYYEGEWKGIALRSTSGRANQLYRAPNDDAPPLDTPLLARCPNLHAALERFECPLVTTRLLSLAPGSKIREHTDDFLGPEYGLVRLHVPITTDPRVNFHVGGERLHMGGGEVWYIDFSRPHRVENGGDDDRVHLVIDCRVNDWLLAMIPFPPFTPVIPI